MKGKVIGKKNAPDEAGTVIDPISKEVLFKPSEITTACVEYCSNLLTNKKPKDEYEKDFNWKRLIHKVRMKEVIKNDLELSQEMFNKAMKDVIKKGGRKYDDIMKGGKALHDALFRLYEEVWKQEKKPDKWKNTTIVQINKSNGKDKANLDNRRHIHTKEPIVKFFTHILTNEIKPMIVESISPFQIGAIPGHRSEETYSRSKVL